MDPNSLPLLLSRLVTLCIPMLFLAAGVVAIIRRKDYLAAIVCMGSTLGFVAVLANTVILWDLEDWVSNGPHPIKQQILAISSLVAVFGNLVFALGFLMMMSSQRRKGEPPPLPY